MTMDTDGDEIPVHEVCMRVCQACLDGVGEECHTPGCALYLHRVDIPISSGLYTIIDPVPPAPVESADAGESDAAFVGTMASVVGGTRRLASGTDVVDIGRSHLRRLVALACRALTPPSTAAGGMDDGWQAERERLRKLMWDHALTLPISQRAAWIEPMGVVRRGRFLTNQEKLQNFAEGLDMPLDQLTSALARDPAVLDRTPDLPGTPASSAMPGPAVRDDHVLPTVHLSKGCFYRDAKGEKVGPVFRYSGDTWHAVGSTGVWSGNGKLTGIYGGADLVSEWVSDFSTARVRASEPVRHDDAKGEAVAWQWVIGDPPWTCVSSEKASIDRLVARHGGACVALGYIDRREAAPLVQPTLAAWIEKERDLARIHCDKYGSNLVGPLLDRLEAANPTLPTAPAPAVGMERAVEIVRRTHAEYGGSPIAQEALEEALIALRANTLQDKEERK